MAPGLVTATTNSHSMNAYTTENYRLLPLGGLLREAHRDHGPLQTSRHWR